MKIDPETYYFFKQYNSQEKKKKKAEGFDITYPEASFSLDTKYA